MNAELISTVHVSVCRLLSVLGNGAAIFTAMGVSGETIRVVVPPRAFARAPVAGESWIVEGAFREDGKYGRQLHATGGRYELPRGHLLIRYLSEHPDFRGIGIGKARRLWEAFGERLYHILSNSQLDELEQVVSPSLARQLVEVWGEKHQEAEMVEFLDAHGLEWRLATVLHRVWGSKALELLQGNPYHLLAFASWSRVDAVGTKLDVATDDPRRLVGAVEACLYEHLQRGDTVVSATSLQMELGRRVGLGLVQRAISSALDEGAVIGNNSTGYQAFGAWALEHGIATRIRSMLGGEAASRMSPLSNMTSSKWAEREMQKVEATQGFPLNEEQREAVKLPFSHHFCLLTGGAGVGKTAVLRAVLQLAQAQHLSILQMALAGRAAQRMEQATGHPAMTIAKFLGAVRSGACEVTSETLIVVDEASMLDLPTTYRMLQNMPNGARLMLVGDAAQLPPIGFGLVLHRLVGNVNVPQVHLQTVHRQAASSGIPAAAADVRQHVVPAFVEFKGKHPGVSFIDCPPDDVMPLLRSIATLWAGEDWQALAAVRGGKAGTRHINGSFHRLVDVDRAEGALVPGEPVIHLVNDYERSLMNGALGRVVSVDEGGAPCFDFDGERYDFRPDELPGRLELAYAISVHKAQGSQFKRVVVIISKTRLLDHSLIYTALTRGIEQVVFIGNRLALDDAVASVPIAGRRGVAFTV